VSTAYTAAASLLVAARWPGRFSSGDEENRGKRTPGVDGVASLTPKQRLQLAESAELSDWQVAPIAGRTFPNREPPRSAAWAFRYADGYASLVKLALEPEWVSSV